MDPPYWQTAGYDVDFPFENYEWMADFMRRRKGKVMVSINDHPDIRSVFEDFHMVLLISTIVVTINDMVKPAVVVNW